jgi:predicted hotdog family 3-hydroxylacyl-ACP dehydratase
MLIDPDRIAALIPHAGAMCLLDTVEDWDDTRIVCLTTTHRSPDNPLRREGRLGILCGIEYAAQAMAVHAALNASSCDRPNVGYLASLRSVTFTQDRLDVVQGTLTVEATCVHRETGRAVYGFGVKDGERGLVQGRAVVVFEPGTP